MLLRELSPPEADPEAEAAQDDLAAYASMVHGWEAERHHREWVRLLTETDDDLLIIAPPGSAKTAWVGVAFCGWYLGHYPDRHIIYCSNTSAQANKPGLAVRETIATSEAYRRVFPSTLPDFGRRWAANEWFLKRPEVGDKDASFVSVGMFGAILGARADLIILDDVNDQENTATQYQRDKCWDWVTTTLFSRRRDMPRRTRIIAIMTRWHHDDIAYHLEKMGFHTVVMPVIDEEGVNIWPEKYSPDMLQQAQLANPHRFQGMYMGRPTPPEGVIWKGEYWQYYEPGSINSRWVLQSWDTAFKPEERNDYSACTTWAIFPGGYALIDVYKQKVDFPDLEEASILLARKWRPNIILIEDKASGQSLLQVLRRKTRLPILAVKADNDKQNRSWAVVGLAQAGRVWLPKTATWLADYEQEMEQFPDAAHDDQVDSTAHALGYFQLMEENGHMTIASSQDAVLPTERSGEWEFGQVPVEDTDETVVVPVSAGGLAGGSLAGYGAQSRWGRGHNDNGRRI
jgi:predicted phage terminase large subunit-like protein